MHTITMHNVQFGQQNNNTTMYKIITTSNTVNNKMNKQLIN